MRLRAWQTVWMNYDVDFDQGRVSRRFIRHREPPPSISGQGSMERTLEHGSTFFCLYRWAGRLFFRAGQRQWDLADSGLQFDFRVRGENASEFRVLEGGKESFRCSYTHRLRSFLAQFDPTYDELDFEQDHFLAFVGSLTLPLKMPAWPDWVDGAPAAAS